MPEDRSWKAYQLPQAEVVELAGKWKHGWVPLDPVATASKLHKGPGGRSKHRNGHLAPAAPRQTARQKYEANAPKRLSPPRTVDPGHDYRMDKNGKYELYKNGRKVTTGPSTVTTREKIARAKRDVFERPRRSPEAAKVDAKNKRIADENAGHFPPTSGQRKAIGASTDKFLKGEHAKRMARTGPLTLNDKERLQYQRARHADAKKYPSTAKNLTAQDKQEYAHLLARKKQHGYAPGVGSKKG